MSEKTDKKNTDRQRHGVIAGGGIAGLASAICLARFGWQVTLLESASAFEDIGAGVQISPNGSRILEAMGVLQELNGKAFEPEALEMRHGKSGRQLLYLPMREKARERWGAPYLQVYRPDLIAAFLKVIEQQPDISTRNSCTAKQYTNQQDGVQINTEDGELIQADLLVAADGVHSTLREQVVGESHSPARFTGNVAWRAIVPIDVIANRLVPVPPPTACVWTGEGKHAVTTRIRGGKWINFVGITEQDNWQQEGWRVKGSIDEALADFDQWNPTITAILQAAAENDNLYRWALLDRPPLPSWSDGRTVLVGDAAHASLPSLAQGAVQAIEDAWELANTHQQERDISSANSQFFQSRIKRTSRVQKESAANLHLFHKRGLLNQFISYTPVWVAGKLLPAAIYRRNDWLYGKAPTVEA